MGQGTGKARFPLGRTLATPGALAAAAKSGDSLGRLLARHQGGDWGETCPEDARMNEDALTLGGRIFSAYCLRDGTKLWIITGGDRSATTTLLPEEY